VGADKDVGAEQRASAEELTVDAQRSAVGYGHSRVRMTFSRTGVSWTNVERPGAKMNVLPWSDISRYDCYANAHSDHALYLLDDVDGDRGGTFKFRRIDLRHISTNYLSSSRQSAA
jgi:hypothetical protein